MRPQSQLNVTKNFRNPLVESADYLNLTKIEKDYLYFIIEIMKQMLLKEHITNWKEYIGLEHDEADEWVYYDFAVDAPGKKIIEMNMQLIHATCERNALIRQRSICAMFVMFDDK